jgi:hypothetical protein
MDLISLISSGIQNANTISNISDTRSHNINIKFRILPELNSISIFSIGIFTGILGIFTYNYINNKKNIVPSAPNIDDIPIPDYPVNGTITQSTTSYNAPNYYQK